MFRILWDAVTGAHKNTLTGHTWSGQQRGVQPGWTQSLVGVTTAHVPCGMRSTQKHTHGAYEWVNSVAFSPDGLTIASGVVDGTVHPVGCGHRRAQKHTHGAYAFGQKRGVQPGWKHHLQVGLWDAVTGAHKNTLTGHTVGSTAWRSDGRGYHPSVGCGHRRTQKHTHGAYGSTAWRSARMEAPCYDGTVLLWDASSDITRVPDVRGPSAIKMNVTDGEEANLEVLNRDGIIIEFNEHIVSSSLKLTYEDGTDLGWESTVKDNSVTLTPIEGEELVHETSYVVRGTVRDGVGNETDLTLTFVAVKPPGTTPNALEADINGDGVVNILDLVLVASNLGQTGQNAGDVNGDGVVNILDLVKVAGALGNAAAAPSLYPQVLEMFTSADVQGWLTQAQHLKLTDATSQRGILFLEQLLAALIPKETALLPNYPNPFNPETWIPYRLAEDAFVTLTIYNGSGRVVRTLDVGHRTAAFYESRAKAIYWDGRNEFGEGVASGVYFYHLSAGDYSATRKMLILK